MALTHEQKRTLFKVVGEIFSGQTKVFTSKEMVALVEEKMGYKIPNVSIVASLRNHYSEDIKYEYRSDIQRYVPLRPTLKFNEVRKEKNLLFFDEEGKIYYDFITKKFNIPNIEEEYRLESPLNDWKELYKVLQYEWFYNYTNDLWCITHIIHNFSKEDYEKMPSGLYQALQENENEFEYKVFEKCILKAKYGKYGAFIQYARFGKEVDIPFIQKMIKTAQLSIFVRGRFPYTNDFNCFINLYNKINKQYEIDTNRDFFYNLEQMEEISNRERNERLAKKLQRLNFINGFEIDDYVVVVPQSQADKQAEGRMQHNCVGYHYDESILRGENLIFFLRKKEDKDHSYITCRYYVKSKNVAEYRKVNNISVKNDREKQIIEIIGKLITEGLAKEKENN